MIDVAINYRVLLEKYMRHVEDMEGSMALAHLHTPPFSDVEIAELRRLGDEIDPDDGDGPT